MSMLTNLLNKLSHVVSIPRLLNFTDASLLCLMRPTLRSTGVREWASLREKNQYGKVMLVMQSHDEAVARRVMLK
jgi:hypothetical protein